ncbi:hypothetical protein [Treponema bryantii]|nr:hypothetical protein [Treponema bryantii]
MNNVNCKLDKDSYAKNENITLTYYGYFEDSNDIGDLRIDFTVYKLINGENDFENLTEVDFENPENISSFSEGLYYVTIKENEEMSSFKDSIVFSINESGEYELFVAIGGSTYNHPYGGTQTFSFPITITE